MSDLPSRRPRLFAAICALLVALSPGAASAQPAEGRTDSQLSISFRVDSDSSPTHVCVVSESWDASVEGPAYVVNLASWADRVVGVRRAGRDPIDGISPLDEDPVQRAVSSLFSHARYVGGPRAGCAGGEYCSPTFSFFDREIAEASSRASRVSSSTFDARTLVCSRYAAARQSRLVVLDVQFLREIQNAPRLSGLRVLGSTAAAIALSNDSSVDRGDREKFAVRVIDGDYLSDTEPGVNLDGQISLRLVPRCASRTIELPAGVPPDNLRISLSASGSEPASAVCEGPKTESGRFVRMQLPNFHEAGPREIQVEAGGSPAVATLADTWTTRESPDVLRPRLRKVRFSWRPDCMYSGAWLPPKEPERGRDGDEATAAEAPERLDPSTCPDARLAGGAVTCTSVPAPAGSEEGLCHYECGVLPSDAPAKPAARGPDACWSPAGSGAAEKAAGSTSLPFDLPASVELCHRGIERWDDSLGYPGQELTGFVPAAQRSVEVDFTRWTDLDELVQRANGAIRYIKLRDANGVERQIAPSTGGRTRVLVPGATCGEILTFDVVGDRNYDIGYAPIHHGRIEVPHPRHVEQKLSFWGSLGGGLSIVGPHGATAPGQLPDPSFDSGYRRPDTQPSAILRLGLAGRYPELPLSGEIGLMYMVGPRAYYPIRTSSVSRTDSREVPYSHIGLELSAFVYPGCGHPRPDADNPMNNRVTGCKNFAFGLGSGFYLANAILANDDRLVGSARPVVGEFFLLRVYVSRLVSFQAHLGALFGETTIYHAFSPARGVSAVPSDTVFFFFDLGARIGL